MYVWADGIYVKAGLEKDKAAMLVADRGAARWAEGRARGGERVSRVDGELGGAAAGSQGARAAGAAAGDRRRASRASGAPWRAVFPTVREQRCWNHRIVNVLDTLPKKLQGEGARAGSRRCPTPRRGRRPSGLKRALPGVGDEEGRGQRRAAGLRRTGSGW